MAPTIERLTSQDTAQLVALSTSVGWDDTPEDIESLLGAGQVFGHKSEDGQLLSSAAICVYGQGALASLGLVIVHPSQQGRGLGRAAVLRCLASLPKQMPVMLAATAQGVPLYERLGFRRVGTLAKVICDAYHPPEERQERWLLSRLSATHLDRIVDLDGQAVGAKRRRLLAARIRQADDAVVLTEADGATVGFGLTVQGPENLLIGPVVAPSDSMALAIVDRLAQGHKGKVRMDVPSRRQQFLCSLAVRGFQVVNTPPVMMLNASALPGDTTLYGIASQMFG